MSPKTNSHSRSALGSFRRSPIVIVAVTAVVLALVAFFLEHVSPNARANADGPSPARQIEAELAKLAPAITTLNAQFGTAVAVDGDTLVVGAPSETGADFGGAVYIFVRTGQSWTLQMKLLPKASIVAPEAGKA